MRVSQSALCQIACPGTCPSSTIYTGPETCQSVKGWTIIAHDKSCSQSHKKYSPLRSARNRQYAIGLSERGRNAIQGVEGLWPLVKAEGAEIGRFVLHFGKREQNLKRRTDNPSLLINRSQLAARLLEELERRHGPKRLKVRIPENPEGLDTTSHNLITRLKYTVVLLKQTTGVC
jgi:hypothetical protein